MTNAPYSELETLSLSAARERVAAGTLSAATLAEQHYERIAAIDPKESDGINSYLSLTRERALAQAAKVDADAKAGNPLGPLAGVPIGMKDVLTMRGAPSTAGSKILEGYHPPYDATVVGKLEAAGAVLLGKFNCDEFAMGSSNENSAYGARAESARAGPRAGWLFGWLGGGGGCRDYALASLGTDTGGSIRQPAAFCGVVGVLPTYGRVSRYRADCLRLVAGSCRAVHAHRCRCCHAA